MQIKEYSIELRNIHLYAHHGVMPQEREVGAWFTIDLKLRVSDCNAAYNDEITGTVSYADVYETVCEEMKKPSRLLEHVGKRICECIYSRFESVTGIEITVCKDTPPMGGDGLNACVTLTTTR